MVTPSATCECGLCEIKLSRMPAQRMFCHCTICQEVYGRPFTDIMMTDARTIEIPNERNIDFKRYKKPPALDRGSCLE
jgi:hypothetical protein